MTYAVSSELCRRVSLIDNINTNCHPGGAQNPISDIRELAAKPIGCQVYHRAVARVASIDYKS